MLSLWGGGEQEAFQKVLTAFTKETGIKTKYESARDFLPVVRSRLAAGNPPMVAIIPRPGIVADLAKEGSLISLDDLGLDADAINENYGEAWTNLTTVDGTTYGVVAKANSKSVVWYRPDDSKVQPVETFDELKTLTDELDERRHEAVVRSVPRTRGRSPTGSRTSTPAPPGRTSTTSCSAASSTSRISP